MEHFSSMPFDLKLVKVFKLLQNCWARAEDQTRSAAEEMGSAQHENTITNFLYLHLGREFAERNQEASFERAFREDIDQELGPRAAQVASRLSKGLIARVLYHHGPAEALTVGDLGVVLGKPRVHVSGDTLRCSMRQRGIAAQAKRQDGKGHTGKLTPHQEDVLRSSHRLDYLAFLLYLYDDYEKWKLSKLAWVMGKGKSVEQIKHLLSSVARLHPTRDDPPKGPADEIYSSEQVLRFLSEGRIGTGDASEIQRYVSPKRIPHFNIEITWRDGTPPGPIHLATRTIQIQTQFIRH